MSTPHSRLLNIIVARSLKQFQEKKGIQCCAALNNTPETEERKNWAIPREEGCSWDQNAVVRIAFRGVLGRERGGDNIKNKLRPPHRATCFTAPKSHDPAKEFSFFLLGWRRFSHPEAMLPVFRNYQMIRYSTPSLHMNAVSGEGADAVARDRRA